MGMRHAVDQIFDATGADSFTEATFVQAIRTYLAEEHKDMFTDEQLINIFRYINVDGNEDIDKADLEMYLNTLPRPVYPSRMPSEVMKSVLQPTAASNVYKNDLIKFLQEEVQA